MTSLGPGQPPVPRQPAPRQMPVVHDRAWGSWQMLDEVPGYKIKRMRVHPGGRLSTQTHDDAVEHWIVVSGVAAYHLDGVVRFATSGHTIDVPAGMRHQMVNPGRDELVVLDIQHGTYAVTNTTFHDDHG